MIAAVRGILRIAPLFLSYHISLGLSNKQLIFCRNAKNPPEDFSSGGFPLFFSVEAIGADLAWLYPDRCQQVIQSMIPKRSEILLLPDVLDHLRIP